MNFRVKILLIFVLNPSLCLAAVSGQPCGDCHTMHNSQNGDTVAQNLIDGTLETSSSPNSGLLKTNCIGCHEGTNTSGGISTPYVLDLDIPSYGTNGTGTGDATTLAGGNFYWVTLGSHSCGHNVAGIAAVDGNLGTTPPGGSDMGSQLTCAGASGCHGDRTESGQVEAMYKSHHWSRTKNPTWKDGSNLADSYRFLLGVQGLGDSDYEYQPDVNNHNKYYGIDRTSEDDSANGTISGFCADCHGLFHEGTDEIASGTFGTSGVWLRHPTNFDMSGASSSSEYDNYNGGTGTGNPYSVISPVGIDDTTTNMNTTIYSQSDDAIVMCISCHRAHGTPYGAILRWNYQDWPGAGYNGCAVCHTSKD